MCWYAPIWGVTPYRSRALLCTRSFRATRPRGERPACSWRSSRELSRFNPRTHAGRDSTSLASMNSRASFNPRAHAGRDLRLVHAHAEQVGVSTHAPTRGATGAAIEIAGIKLTFQPTRPRGARRARPSRLPASSSRFNPRAHAGRDARQHGSAGVQELVSTHAPTRGATRGAPLVAGRVPCVSTHAPTRGATRRPAQNWSDAPGFNPRAHAGRDRNVCDVRLVVGVVSTHAPTRGATVGAGFAPGVADVSTHAPTRGATIDRYRLIRLADVSTHAPTRGATVDDHAGMVLSRRVSTHAPTRGATVLPAPFGPAISVFQPTRPRGARPASSRDTWSVWTFQPTRPRGARRHAVAVRRRVDAVSTHAPTRGATDVGRHHDDLGRVSTHAPTRGATVGDIGVVLLLAVSTHAPTRGATEDALAVVLGNERFQPTRPRGARRW